MIKVFLSSINLLHVYDYESFISSVFTWRRLVRRSAVSESQGPMLIHVDSPKVPRNDTRLFFTDFKKTRGHHVVLKK